MISVILSVSFRDYPSPTGCSWLPFQISADLTNANFSYLGVQLVLKTYSFNPEYIGIRLMINQIPYCICYILLQQLFIIRYCIIYPEIKYSQDIFPMCLEMIYTFHIILFIFAIINCCHNLDLLFSQSSCYLFKAMTRLLIEISSFEIFHLKTNTVPYKYYSYMRK